jgi:hypothetical protein
MKTPFLSVLLFLAPIFVLFGQDKFITNKYIIDKSSDDKIKKEIKKYKLVELKISTLKNYIKSKHKNIEGVNFTLNIEDENIEFRLFENDIIDEKFTLIENNLFTKPQKSDVLTFAGYTNNNPEYHGRLFISDKIIMGYFNTPDGKYIIQPIDKFRKNIEKKQDYDKLIIYNFEDEILNNDKLFCGNFLKDH